MKETNYFIGTLEDITGRILTIARIERENEELGIRVINLRCTNEKMLESIKKYVKVGDLFAATYDDNYTIEKVSFIARKED